MTSGAKVFAFYNESNTIGSILPLVMRNGATIERLSHHCWTCNGTIDTDTVRGDIMPSLKGYRITSFGYCEPCHAMTPFMYDVVLDGGSFTLEAGTWRGWEDGEVVTLEFKKGDHVDPPCDV